MSSEDLVDVEDAVLDLLRDLKASGKVPRVRELIELLEPRGFDRDLIIEAVNSLRRDGFIQLVDEPPPVEVEIPAVSPAEGLDLEDLPQALGELVEETEEFMRVLRSLAEAEGASTAGEEPRD